MSITPDIEFLLDAYERQRERRERRLRHFWESSEGCFLIVQHPYKNVFSSCNSVQKVVDNNLEYLDAMLQLEWTDDLFYLEPWVGTVSSPHLLSQWQ